MTDKKLALSVIALIVIAAFFTTTTYAALSISQNLASSGTINVSANLNVFSDAACTVPLSSFSWGSISPGATTNQTVYIKNIGSGVALTLSMTAYNWSPSTANNYITLTWNPTSNIVAPGSSTKAVLTLSVSSNIIDIQNFNVQILITGSGT